MLFRSAQCALGILPVGTMNVLALELGISPDLERALAVIRAGHRRRIDLGYANGRRFLQLAGVGLDAEVVRKTHPEAKRAWGPWSYLLTVAQETVTPAPHLRVKTAGLDAPVSSLSGGNQQKVVLAKWLARELEVLIVDEPTRGVDVGAKAAIHGLLDDLAGRGLAIVLISSELPELLNLSTRILVMRAGRLVGQVERAAASQERVLHLMAGVE